MLNGESMSDLQSVMATEDKREMTSLGASVFSGGLLEGGDI